MLQEKTRKVHDMAKKRPPRPPEDKPKNKKIALDQRRQYVAKSNEFIQRARYSMTLQQQRILLYLISKTKPMDTIDIEYTFEIKEFCEVCGLDKSNGAIYEIIKADIKHVADFSRWVIFKDKNEETLFRWLNTVKMRRNSGMIKIKFHESLSPYLYDLREYYTQYPLSNVLAFKSKYSIRLYELLRSYSNNDYWRFEINELKQILDAETYTRTHDFVRKVLEPAEKEINQFADDMRIEYRLIKTGRAFSHVEFRIWKPEYWDQMATWQEQRHRLNGYERNEKRAEKEKKKREEDLTDET